MPSTAADRRDHAQIAALARVSQEPSGAAMTAQARRTFLDSFEAGHECKLCPSVIIDQELPEPEHRRQVNALKRLHFLRLATQARYAAKIARDLANAV